jgi:histidinol dehydrogenase
MGVRAVAGAVLGLSTVLIAAVPAQVTGPKSPAVTAPESKAFSESDRISGKGSRRAKP